MPDTPSTSRTAESGRTGSGRLRRALTIIGCLLAAVGLLGAVAHAVPFVSNTWARLAAGTPILIVIGIVGLVVLLASRAWMCAVVAAVVVAIGIGTQVPLFVGTDEARAASDITVMQANIYLGQADAASVVREIRDNRVDIATVVELTDDAIGKLDAAGIASALPYRFVVPRRGGGGAGIYSRYPLTDEFRIGKMAMANLRAVVDLPGVGRRAIYALHPIPPWPEPAWRWAYEVDLLSSTLGEERLPLILGADFNSTYDHARFRRLLAQPPGLVDAADHLGAGIVATYPANRRFPPVLALDRVMTRGGPMPTSFRRVELPGSDHTGVIATVRP